MNKQKICIIGDGLSGSATAAIMSKQYVSIDLYSGNKRNNKNLDNRTTAVSESNFQFIKSNLNLSNDIFFPCKEINLFFEDKKKIINFLNFNEKNKNSMYIFKNKNLKKKLDKIITLKQNIKLIKKNVENINSEDTSISLGKKKIFYNLIILSIGGLLKFY